MSKLLVIDKYWKRIEIDLDNPEPMLRTNCAICWRELFPPWQDANGTREIGEDAVCAVCWKCSSYGTDKRLKVSTVEEMKEERKKDNKERARARRKFYVPKKKREKIIKNRVETLNKRPCGCSIKGRHKATCPLAKEYKKKGQSDES